MKKSDLIAQMKETFERLINIHEQANKEYAHGLDDNSFNNFIRVGNYLKLSPEKSLLVYFLKHVDGIIAYVNGTKSQRESIYGRIDDAQVYLELLRGMIKESETKEFRAGLPEKGRIKSRMDLMKEDSPIQSGRTDRT